MVGYSRLMEADEPDTMSRYAVLRAELIDPTITGHNGSVVKSTGDGLLVEFSSAVDAVQCAVGIQRGMASRTPDEAPERRIEFRIGINVGEIVAEGGDIYGNGVNLAVRIESLADPGGILVSANVHEQVRNKVQLGFEDLGSRSVKNISIPVHVFLVHLDDSFAGRTTDWRRPRRKRVVPVVLGVIAVSTVALAALLFRGPGLPEAAVAGEDEPLKAFAVLPFAVE
jgi:adenylate cyclase